MTVTWRPSWPDVRNPEAKRIVCRPDPYHERPAIEIRLSQPAYTFHIAPADARELAERLLELARIVERPGRTP